MVRGGHSFGEERDMMTVLAADAGIFNQFALWLSSYFGASSGSVLALLQIIGIDIVLAGDNAVVIALACRSLPPGQRMIGIALGAGVAIVLRIFFTIIIQQLLDVPFLKLIGGLALLWIAIKLVTAQEAGAENVASGSSLWEAVRIVAIADVMMSLDNVLAIAAAAKGDQILVIVGLLISIPLVVFGSTLVLGLLHRFPILVWAGAALLGWIAGELIASEPVLRDYVSNMAAAMALPKPTLVKVFEVGGALLVVLIGWLLKRFAGRPAPA